MERARRSFLTTIASLLTAATVPPRKQIKCSISASVTDATVTLTASVQPSFKQKIVRYILDFGDGTVFDRASLPPLSHTYITGGTFTVRLTIWDSSGQSAWDAANVGIIVYTQPSPPSSGRTMLTQSDITFLGGFKLGGDDFRLAQGMTFRRKGDGTKTILQSSGGQGDICQVYEFLIPSSLSTGAWSGWQTVAINRGVISSWNGKLLFTPETPIGTFTDPTTRGLYFDPVDNVLYGIVGQEGYDDYYLEDEGSATASTITRTTFNSGADTWSGTARHFLTGIGFKRLSGGLCAIPQWYADAYCGGKRLASGFGGYRSIVSYCDVSMGPALRAIDPPTSGDMTGLASQEVLFYDDNTGHKASRPAEEQGYAYDANPRLGTGLNAADTNSNSIVDKGPWQWTDVLLQSGVWIDTGTKHGFLVCPMFGTGDLDYLNSVVSSTQARMCFMLFNPMHFAPASGGNAWDPEPTELWNPSFPGWTDPSVHTTDFHYAAALAFDPVDNRLYVSLSSPGPDSYPTDVKTMYVFQVS